MSVVVLCLYIFLCINCCCFGNENIRSLLQTNINDLDSTSSINNGSGLFRNMVSLILCINIYIILCVIVM